MGHWRAQSRSKVLLEESLGMETSSADFRAAFHHCLSPCNNVRMQIWGRTDELALEIVDSRLSQEPSIVGGGPTPIVILAWFLVFSSGIRGKN